MKNNNEKLLEELGANVRYSNCLKGDVSDLAFLGRNQLRML